MLSYVLKHVYYCLLHNVFYVIVYIPLDPKIMKHEGFKPYKYGLRPLKMREPWVPWHYIYIYNNSLMNQYNIMPLLSVVLRTV